jgi:hypothetical protein
MADGNNENYMMPHRDDDFYKARLGDGVSRPMPGADIRMVAVRVIQPGTLPMRVVLSAESPTKAVAYARARWPSAHVSLCD